ncbi:MAG TPA: ABC transporter ATP-binding protein, partial [Actinomycetota bacterium]
MITRSRAPLGPDGEAAKPKDPRGTFRRIVEIFRPYRGQLALLAATIVITAGLGVVNPLLIKAVFDKALFGPNKICSGVPCPNLPLLYRLVALGLAIPVVTSLIGVGQTFLSNSLGLRLMRDLRDRLYAHLQSLSMRFFTSTRTGEIQSRLTNDVAGVQSIVTDTASSILSNVVIIVSSFAAMAFLSWQLTILSLILVPLFVFFTFRVGKSRRALQSVAQQSLADLTAITEETLLVSGILLAKVFGRQRYEITRFTKENQRFTDIQLRQRMTGRYFFALVGTFFSVTPFLVYLVAGLFQHSGLTPGLIV